MSASAQICGTWVSRYKGSPRAEDLLEAVSFKKATESMEEES